MRVIILFIAILFLILSIRYVFYFEDQKVYRSGDVFEANITLLSEPKVSEFTQTFKVNGITIQTSRTPYYHYGDALKISGTVSDASFKTQDGKTVSYMVVKNPQIKTLDANLVIKSAAFFRSRIQDSFNAYLPKNEAALLFGIVFGGTQGFDKDMQDAFKNAGVMHVVAASGMNVSMVAGFLVVALERIMNRRRALALSIIGVFYYALLSGFSPSIVRASIMASAFFLAEALGRQTYGVVTLFITAFIMLFFSPGTLFDAGFLLSFTSTLGIILIKPYFDSFAFFKRTKAVSDDVATSVSAQLGSIPVMVSLFGSYSVLSILVNALVLWTIPFLMVLGGVAALCAIALPFVSVPFLYLSYPLLLYFEAIVGFFGKIQMLAFSSVPWEIIVGYYLVLFGLILLVKKNQNAKRKHQKQN